MSARGAAFADDARFERLDGGPDEGPPADDITILSGRTLADIRRDQPEEVIAGGLAVRRNTTAMSSMGGTGKTTLIVQGAIEATQGLPLFGVEDFRPIGAVRALYVNAEDSLANLNYTLARMLPSYELDRVPYDEFVIAACGGQFVLDPLNARALAERIRVEGYSLVALDPAISFLPPGIKFIDPGAIREFLNGGIGHLQRETTAAYWLSHHDNKAGAALSGPADWGNFCRLALHLERGDVDGQLTVTTVKANLGYRFKCLTLERDPATGRATAINLERFGDRRGKVGTVEDARDVLARLFRTNIMSIPSERRTKDALRAALYTMAAPLGVKRQHVRDFADCQVEYEERKIGRNYCKIAVRLVDDEVDE